MEATSPLLAGRLSSRRCSQAPCMSTRPVWVWPLTTSNLLLPFSFRSLKKKSFSTTGKRLSN
ncbi:hypothetical protein ACP70R_001804 [Stipagrostis hirtigluma subsp. patula]